MAEVRISNITYDGNSSVGAPVVVKVHFKYQSLAHPIYSNEHSELETFDQMVSTIAAATDPHGDSSFELAYKYGFHRASLDEGEVLSRIDRGRWDDAKQTVAEFTYQAWDPDRTSRAKMAGPFSPPGQTNESKTWKDAVWDPSPVGMNYQRSVMVDFNRDGLPDRVSGGTSTYSPDPETFGSQANAEWRITRLVRNPAGFLPDVEWPSPWPYISRAREGFARTQYWLVGDPDSQNLKTYPEEPGYIFQTLVDVDGDRLPDLVTGFGSPAAWYHNTGTGFHPTQREAPDWWNPQFTRSGSSSLPAHQQSPRDGTLAVGTSWTHHNVFDLDADGKQDGFTEDLVEKVTRYEYDGLGRLRRVQADPSTTLVLNDNWHKAMCSQKMAKILFNATPFPLTTSFPLTT